MLIDRDVLDIMRFISSVHQVLVPSLSGGTCVRVLRINCVRIRSEKNLETDKFKQGRLLLYIIGATPATAHRYMTATSLWGRTLCADILTGDHLASRVYSPHMLSLKKVEDV